MPSPQPSSQSGQTIASQKADALALFPLLKSFPIETRNQLATQLQKRTYAKGQPVYSHGDAVQHLHLIQNGWVKLSRLTLDGNEAVLDIVGDKQAIGLFDMFAQPAHTATATAIEATQVVVLPAESFRQALNHHPSIAINLLQVAATQHGHLMQEIEGRILQKAPQRLGCFLLKLLPGNSLAKGPVVLHLPYDKTLLAARLGMQPETFSRALSTLKKELGFTVRGSTISLPHAEKLVAYTCSACSGSFPCVTHLSGKA